MPGCAGTAATWCRCAVAVPGDPQGPEDTADGGCADPVAELEQFALDPLGEVGRRRGARGSGPFPMAPSRTGRAGFPASGSPVLYFRVVAVPRSRMTPSTVSALCITHTSLSLTPRSTCAPSPCGRLSRPPWRAATPATTTGTPSPWGSRPLGDPVVRPRCTYRARHRLPTHPLDRPHWAMLRATEVARAGLPGPGTARHRSHASYRRTVAFDCWGLDFKQSSLSHIARASRHPALNASRRPPLP